jgi:hypothetical protein
MSAWGKSGQRRQTSAAVSSAADAKRPNRCAGTRFAWTPELCQHRLAPSWSRVACISPIPPPRWHAALDLTYSNLSRNKLIISSSSTNNVSYARPHALASLINASTAAANFSAVRGPPSRPSPLSKGILPKVFFVFRKDLTASYGVHSAVSARAYSIYPDNPDPKVNFFRQFG